jgi:phospholipid/cholesterol/gamma-HCH transport system substrate-binding protein
LDLHYRQEITVGGLVLVGIGLFVAGTMWLSGKEFGTRGHTVQVQFADVGNMKEGNPVKVSGVQLGSVRSIRFEDVGRVMVTLSLDRRIQPRLDATAAMEGVGLVGDVVINFHPGTSSEPLPEGAIIQGTTERGLSAIGTDLGLRAQDVMAGVGEIANKRLADDLHATLAALQQFLRLYGNPNRGPTAELTSTLAALNGLATRLDSTLAVTRVQPVLSRADTALGELRDLAAQFSTTGATLDSVLRRLNRGEGTLGRFVQDTAFYDNAQRLLRSLQAFADTLRKHPGKLTVQVRVF